jgi:secondary thiamine-phosphate synthase enzyme
MPWSGNSKETSKGGQVMDSFDIQTGQRTEFVEVTELVRQAVGRRGIKQGICIVYCPHTTAAITINENADPDVVHDMLSWLNRAIPQHQLDFRHDEGNSDAHIKSSLVGSSVTVLVDQGDLVLGRWQGVYFCEFDGPRTRSVKVQCLG